MPNKAYLTHVIFSGSHISLFALRALAGAMLEDIFDKDITPPAKKKKSTKIRKTRH